jgi:hypothetical protein
MEEGGEVIREGRFKEKMIYSCLETSQRNPSICTFKTLKI